MPTGLQADSVGPVDVAVIAFDDTEIHSDLAPALAELQETGTVRIIDLAFLRRDDEGIVTIVEVEDDEAAADFEGVTSDPYDLLSEDDLNDIAEALDPGTSALVVVWENAWASRLAAAVRASRGQVIVQERIPRDVVHAAISALDEN